MRKLLEIILSINHDSPLRVAIDGVDASGKTTLADNLAEGLKSHGKKVIRASVDGFHFPRNYRYLRGRRSPDGYYHHSFDYNLLIEFLLKPLSPGGNLIYRTAVFDHEKNKPVQEAFKKADSDSILIFDGVFSFRPGLIDFWDLKILIGVDPRLVLERALVRKFGVRKVSKKQAQDLINLYLQRYMPGQTLYYEAVDPVSKADIVLDNNDYTNPVIIINRLIPSN